MSELVAIIDEEEEFDDTGSYNHSLVQGNLAHVIRKYSDLSAFIELSLDTSNLDRARFPDVNNELIPDVCAYPRSSIVDLDILVMREMPELVIEVISPRQGAHGIVRKFQAYFALGIRTCWLVDPTIAAVRIYHNNGSSTTYSTGELVDDVLDIRFPVLEIFE